MGGIKVDIGRFYMVAVQEKAVEEFFRDIKNGGM